MLLTTNDKKQWDEALLKLPTNLQDIYYSCDYYKIYESTSDSKGMCFLYEEDSEIYLYPFLKTKINLKFSLFKHKQNYYLPQLLNLRLMYLNRS